MLEFVKGLMNVENLATLVTTYGGLYLVCLIIFAETGLFIGFFLPGDSLLFVTGLMIANSQSPNPTSHDGMNLVYWIVLIALAAIIGNMVGYWFGRKTGPLLFEKRDTLLFKKKHVRQAHEFYEKRGGSTIILARFVPIVRTFAPIVAGVVAMDRKKFVLYNIVGSLAWVSTMILPGYFLGGNEFVKANFEKIVLVMILVTTGPVLFKMFFSKEKSPILEVGADIVEEKAGSSKS
jgi:membrane-associated protein